MQQLALTIDEVLKISSFGRTRLYELINSGQLRAKKCSRRTLILKADLEEFLAGLKDYPIHPDNVASGGDHE